MTNRLPDYPVIPSAPEPVTATPAQRSVVSRTRINRVSRQTRERSLSYAGHGARVPIVYGKARLGPLVAQAVTYQSHLVMCLVWCVGEIEAIDGLYLQDGSAAPASVTATHYTGTTTQGVDPTLAAAISGWTRDLVETVNGETVALAYSVVSIAQSRDMDIPSFVAEIRGKKLYDHREVTHDIDDPTTWEYTENPALALADMEMSTVYGRGNSLDWDSVDDVADDCDEIVAATEARRKLGLVIDTKSPVDDWVDTLSVYAGCYVNVDGDTTRLISNRPASPVASLTAADIVSRSDGAPDIDISIRSMLDVPTVMHIQYTDTTGDVWRDASAYAYADGVLAGTTEWRESTVRLPGITRYTQAYREAVERLNMLALTDLDVSWLTHDEGLKYQVGDVVTVTTGRGLTAKQIRVTDIVPPEPGRWRVSGHEYQDAVYSDAVESEPTYTDTDLPSPLNPPAPTGLTLAEEVYQGLNGIWASRIAVDWDASEYVYLNQWDVEVYDGATLVFRGSTSTNSYASPAVNDDTEYTVKVRTVSTVGAQSSWAEDTITAAGKSLIPSDVPSVDAYEVGGETRANWTPATDVDIWRYEVRYAAVGASWDAGVVIDRVDALRLVSGEVPPGTWDLMVKALDSIGQYSANEARSTYVVTSDSGAYIVDSNDFDSPTLTNMHEYKLWRGDSLTRYVTDAGDTAASIFTGDLTAYTDVAATYHSSCTSEVLSETWDATYSITGTWSSHADREELGATTTLETYLELSDDDIDWDQYAYLTTKRAARYARLRAKTTTTGTLYCTMPEWSANVNVIPRVETGSGTSSASGGVTISTVNQYAAAQSIKITPLGTASRPWTVDNIQVLSDHVEFDVYIFDSDGNLVATPFQWEFRGI